jgi:hypothetical protein
LLSPDGVAKEERRQCHESGDNKKPGAGTREGDRGR